MMVKIEGIDRVVESLRRSMSAAVEEVADQVYVQAQAKTPIKTGNARKNWNKSTSKNNFVVDNRVPYIERLEAGASRQAPKGIIGPTLNAVKGKLK
jgi:hypothetical protein